MWGASVRFGFGVQPPLVDEEAATPLLGQQQETDAPHREEQESTRTAQLTDQDTTCTPYLSHRNIATRPPSSLQGIAITSRSSLPDVAVTPHVFLPNILSTVMAENTFTNENTIMTDDDDQLPPPEDLQHRELANPDAEWNPDNDSLVSPLSPPPGTDESLSEGECVFTNRSRESIASTPPGCYTRDRAPSLPSSLHYNNNVDVIDALGDGTTDSSTQATTDQLTHTYATDGEDYETQVMLFKSFAAKKARPLPLFPDRSEWDEHLDRIVAEKRARFAEEAIVSDEGSEDGWDQNQIQKAIDLSLQVGNSNGEVEDQVMQDVQEQNAKEGDEHALLAQSAIQLLPWETQPNGSRGSTFAESMGTLPNGWEQYMDHEGRPYYFDRNTGQTTWDRPDPALSRGWRVAQLILANEQSAQDVNASSHRSAPVFPRRNFGEPSIHPAKRRALSSDRIPGEVGDEMESIPSQQAEGNHTTSTERDVSFLLDDVRKDLEKLKATTPGSLPAYHPNMKARSHAQVLKARLLPIGNRIVEVVRLAPKEGSRGLELRLWYVWFPFPLHCMN
jgi:hypothetical protein